ncbi:preprotein translocase subunit SecA [Lyticum sinuosum]|uniref:Protein translocase subunit SecA n=1 Tax=Lyticum sinuosum TaxID=1332059 RepID=A0AAE5AHK7_9RICK|nr:preprotein translocase subunit SecA [Lyticum sinuosum]MDZ5761238.1 Protein translocase subunit SecA [Lyticum sinuosum]
MFFSFLKKIFPDQNTKILRNILSIVTEINKIEHRMKNMSNKELSNQTVLFKDRISEGESLDSLLPEAFATVREVSLRILNKRHFDVQLIGGIALHRGMIAQMKTGEGKTLVAPLSIYLNALVGKGVHLITVNDYLARRDAQNIEKILGFLGLKVGCITGNMNDEKRYNAYSADVTYGTNNEFGFDYLRDNLKYLRRNDDYFIPGSMIQRSLHYAIIDEIDSILIDEARTPLIISGQSDNDFRMYKVVNDIIKTLKESDYEIDLKNRSVILSEDGNENLENILKQKGVISNIGSMYDLDHMSIVHYVDQALKAHHLFVRDKDYVVVNGKVLIIDEFTGRIMDGRRYSDGLHQAIEAKEKVRVQSDNQTIASTTFQNYFRLYHKLSGMTGTAISEAEEFKEIYGLNVLDVPTNLPIKREDCDDIVYSTESGKYNGIVSFIEENHKTGRPILVGTTSIESSEKLSYLLNEKKIPHNILNAKYHEKEAKIIAQAGSLNAVTVATNMAGRGTDIMLGGNPDIIKEEGQDFSEIISKVEEEKRKILELGGLVVIGTERHDARRIDEQLRGRSGRQGDPGKTVFYLSLEDKLMKMFGSEKLKNILSKLGLKEDEAIIHPMVTKAIIRAQQKIESMNYESRKNILRYDDVINVQRQAIFKRRFDIIDSNEELINHLKEIHKNTLDQILIEYEEYQKIQLKNDFNDKNDGFLLKIRQIYGLKFDSIDDNEISLEKIKFDVNTCFYKKIDQINDKNILIHILKRIMLEIIDKLWRFHINDLDQIRRGIHLRSYGQQNPLNEYKIESFNAFKQMISDFEVETLSSFMHMHYSISDNSNDDMINSDNILNDNEKSYQNNKTKKNTEKKTKKSKLLKNDSNNNDNNIPIDNTINNNSDQDIVKNHDISRNDPCYCESGLKYKYCHGKIADYSD